MNIDCPKEELRIIGQTKRLGVFVEIANEDCVTDAQNFSDSTDTMSNKSAFTEERSPGKFIGFDLNYMLNNSFDATCCMNDR